MLLVLRLLLLLLGSKSEVHAHSLSRCQLARTSLASSKVGGQGLLRTSKCDTDGMLLRPTDYLIDLRTKDTFNARRRDPNRMRC